MKARILLPMLLLGAITLPARGGIVMTMQEVGADVVVTSTGTLGPINNSRTDFTQETVTAAMTPGAASLTIGTGLSPTVNTLRFINDVLSGPDSFGTGLAAKNATSSSGPRLSIALGTKLGVDIIQAISDDPLTAGSSTWSGSTLASLGVTPGIYTWTVEGALLASGTDDTIVLNIVTPGCLAFPVSVASEAELNAAINCYNAQTVPGIYTINITQDIDLTASTPIITNNLGGVHLVIAGGGFTVDGQGISGVKPFNVQGGPVTMNDLTITGGVSTAGAGGIFNLRDLTLNNCTVTGNSAATVGGGIRSASNVMTLNNSTVSGNTAGTGGGIYVEGGTASLDSVTVADNSATTGGGIAQVGGGTVTLTNTIVGNNSASGSGPDLAGTITSNDYNLIEDTSGATITLQANDIISADPLLGALADNGGPTPTHALLAGSPAIDTGDTTLTTDQRGVPRPQGAADDIGAFEAGIQANALLTVVSLSGQSTDTTPVAEGPAGVFSFTARFCNKDTSPTLTSLFTRTRELTNNNSLVNRDRDGTGTPLGGVGSELDFPLTPDYDDGQLAPQECVDVPYEIGLAVRNRFRFFVDPYGYSVP